MNSEKISMVIRLVLGIAVMVLVIWIGWPLLLAAAIWIIWQYYKAKRRLKKAQEEMEQQYYGTAYTEYKDPETYERPETIPEGTGEVIDVEFTVKNRDKEQAMRG